MAVYISCPLCAKQVRLRQGGVVDPHGEGGGCTFTQTPSSPGWAKKPKAGRAVDEVVEANSQAAEKDACSVCSRQITRMPDGTFKAHQSSKYRWCAGGRLPTKSQIKRANQRKTKATTKKSKRSVWTVSGGLPSLGKR